MLKCMYGSSKVVVVVVAVSARTINRNIALLIVAPQ